MKMKALLGYLSLVLMSGVSHANNGILLTKNHLAISRKADTLGYYGGPVISNAKIVTVFWSDRVNQTIKQDIGPFYKAFAASTQMSWLDQYNTLRASLDGKPGTQQHIGVGSYLGAVTIQPKNTKRVISDQEIQAELQYQIDKGVLPKPDDNTLYMTHFPSNISVTAFGMESCQQFCAYHGFKGSPDRDHFYYGVMPDINNCMNGCGYASNYFGSETAIASHEAIEAITDPYPTPGSQAAYPQAWNDRQGSEIGDLCAGSNNTLRVVSTKKIYTVQSQWDNSKNRCSAGPWQTP